MTDPRPLILSCPLPRTLPLILAEDRLAELRARYRIVETRSHGHNIKLLLKEGSEVPRGSTFLSFDPSHTQVYEDSWMAGAHR